MDFFACEIKDSVCINFDVDEINDIKDATKTLLERFSKAIVEINPLFKVKTLVPCGSMAEWTRNWKFVGHNREPIIEFDYLAVLKSPRHDEITTVRHCDGFMQIIDKNERMGRYCNKFIDRGPINALHGDRVSFAFQMDLLKSVNYLCNCFMFDNKMKFVQKDECCNFFIQGSIQQRGLGCNHCTIYKRSGYLQIAMGDDIGSPYYNHCSLVFKWTSEAGSLIALDYQTGSSTVCKELYVLVDFLPAFELLRCTGADPGGPGGEIVDTTYNRDQILEACTHFEEDMKGDKTHDQNLDKNLEGDMGDMTHNCYLETSTHFEEDVKGDMMHDHYLDKSLEEMGDMTHNCYLVPKMCIKSHSTCWKISNCRIEIDLLQKTSQEHRYVYMILKFISDCLFSGYFEDGSIPTTYKIKTVVLHHIRNCKMAEQSCDLVGCVNQLLNELSVSYGKQSLPHLISGLNLLTANESDDMPRQNLTWHANRCQIIGDVYSFVKDVLGNFLEVLDNQDRKTDMNLLCVVRLLNFIGAVFKLAWMKTEVAPVYEVDKEKLTHVIMEKQVDINSFNTGTEANEDIIIRKHSMEDHWTKYLKVWEYEGVREMYARHHFACPDPPGHTPGRDERILKKAQILCGFFSWTHDDQQKWIAKLAKSENPNDIVVALKEVDIYYIDIKKDKDAGSSYLYKKTN